MKEKNEEMKEVFEQLNEENKTVLNMIAQGMQIAQTKKEK